VTEGTGAAPLPGHVLPVGTRLADYGIEGLIGEGGFGVVYLATDHSLERRVALKEYMPSAIASRAAGSTQIVVKSERHRETFRAGLRSFVNEARLLARFDHPALVKVFRFWEGNGTAYMVMPFYEGPTLKAVLESLGRPPTEAELRAWISPLVDALAVLHAAHCFHRDIAPDNILLTGRGPLLLDFGAARRVIGDMTHALTVVLKPGFAPIEQYGEAKSMAQGAWTDLYALASVVRFAITGTPPVSAVERLMEDRLEPLAELARGRYTARFLEGIDHALAVRPRDRPQDAGAFREALGLAPARPVAVVSVPAEPGHARTSASAAPVAVREPGRSPAPVPMSMPPQGPAPVPVPEPIPFVPLPKPGAAPSHRSPAPGFTTPPAALPEVQPGRRRLLLPSLGAALAGAALIGALVVVLDRPQRDIPPQPAPTPSAATAPRPEPMPATASAAIQSPGPSPTPAPTVVGQPGPSSIAGASAAPPPARIPSTTAARRGEVDAQPMRRPAPAPAPRPPGGDRCSDILRKGSLEPLTAEESATLRRDCR
jgi:serine/threonine protein kinase